MIWEDPSPADRSFGGSGTGRAKSPTRLEAEAYVQALFNYPGKWARLWTEETEVDARRKEQVLRSCAEKGTLRVAVRVSDMGYSVFAQAKDPGDIAEYQRQEALKAQEQGEEPQPQEPGQPYAPEPQPQQPMPDDEPQQPYEEQAHQGTFQ